MCEEFFDKLLWRSGGEFFVEVDYEKMFDAQVANQSNFVLRGSEQMRRIVRTQHFDRVRIKGHNERGSIRRTSVTRSGGKLQSPGKVARADSPDPRLNEGLPFSIYAPRMRETSGRLRIRLRISSREASLICKTPIA